MTIHRNQILTISFSEYCNNQEKSAGDYELIGVHWQGCADASLLPFMQNVPDKAVAVVNLTRNLSSVSGRRLDGSLYTEFREAISGTALIPKKHVSPGSSGGSCID